MRGEDGARAVSHPAALVQSDQHRRVRLPHWSWYPGHIKLPPAVHCSVQLHSVALDNTMTVSNQLHSLQLQPDSVHNIGKKSHLHKGTGGGAAMNTSAIMPHRHSYSCIAAYLIPEVKQDLGLGEV